MTIAPPEIGANYGNVMTNVHPRDQSKMKNVNVKL